MGKEAMKIPPIESRVISLRTPAYGRHRKQEMRKVYMDSFLFLLFLNIMIVAIVLSCINDYLFLEELLTGGFIVGTLGTLKWINTEY